MFYLLKCLALHYSRPARHPPASQVLFLCGLLVLMFDVFVVPLLTPWLGIKRLQQATSTIEVAVYFVYPLLPLLLHGMGRPLTVVSVFVLFATFTSSNVVCPLYMRYLAQRVWWSEPVVLVGLL